jgi:phage regulator Rha-like protein
MFKLNKEEMLNWKLQIVTSGESLRSQIVTSKRGGQRYESYAFTEQGVAMLSSVLNSNRAIQVNIQIMRTFTQMRKMLMTHKELREKIEKMERKYDQRFQVVFDVIKRFLKTDPKDSETKVVGFKDGK